MADRRSARGALESFFPFSASAEAFRDQDHWMPELVAFRIGE